VETLAARNTRATKENPKADSVAGFEWILLRRHPSASWDLTSLRGIEAEEGRS
jgi:hypothetical protein